MIPPAIWRKGAFMLDTNLGVTVREAIFGRRPGVFRIFFTVQGDVVSIVAIRHSAQGPIEP